MKDEFSKDNIETVIQNKKEVKLLGSQTKVKGHTLFEYNTKTREIKEATFKSQIVDFKSVTTESPDDRKTVIVKEGCVYIQALNKKNAIKKLIIRANEL